MLFNKVTRWKSSLVCAGTDISCNIGITENDLPVVIQIVGPYLEDRTPIHFARLMKDVVGGFVPPPNYRNS